MEPSPRCPVCNSAIASDRIAEVQTNLRKTVEVEIATVRREAERDTQRRIAAAVAEAQQKARSQAEALTAENSALKAQVAAEHERARKAQDVARARERELEAQYARRIAAEREDAARGARQAAESRAAGLERELAATNERLSKTAADVATLRAQNSTTVERMKKEFDAKLKAETESAAHNAAAAAKAEAAQAKAQAAELQARQGEAVAKAKADTAAEMAELRRVKEQELQDLRRICDTHRDEELQRQEVRHRQEMDGLKDRLAEMQRKVEQATADQLGRWPEVHLLDDLRDAFPGDVITPVERGEPGADIIHQVMYKGEECGKIVYDAKNRGRWSTSYVDKLRHDRDVEKADHAILVSNKFPADEKHQDLCIRGGDIIIARPHTVVPLATVLRETIMKLHRLGLSSQEKATKTAELYNFINSEAFKNRMATCRKLTEQLEEIDVAEQKAHNNVWRNRGTVIADMRRTLRELQDDVTEIVERAAVQIA